MKKFHNFDKCIQHATWHGLVAARLTDYIKINLIARDPACVVEKIYTVPLAVGVHASLNKEKYKNAMFCFNLSWLC